MLVDALWIVVVAGGSGRRLGGETPKQYLPLAGRPLFLHCLERFVADADLLARTRGHVATLEKRGVRLLGVRTSVLCTQRLNDERERGHNRFVADLHAMERLILALREQAGSDVSAVCGKVGGIADYSRFFGPLSDRLHAVLEQKREKSAYRFPGLGEVCFLRDADASDPLVMLASLVGKWVRELLMDRIVRFYDPEAAPSGYNDPVTARFVDAVRGTRARILCTRKTAPGLRALDLIGVRAGGGESQRDEDGGEGGVFHEAFLG